MVSLSDCFSFKAAHLWYVLLKLSFNALRPIQGIGIADTDIMVTSLRSPKCGII